MRAPIIRRQVETCPFCGAWDPFRKGRGGHIVTDAHTGLKRIYGICRHCRRKLVLQYVAPGNFWENSTQITPMG